jgi:hypothetical protein
MPGTRHIAIGAARVAAVVLQRVSGTPSAAVEQSALRREVVESIADRVKVNAGKCVHVMFVFDFNEIGPVVSQDIPIQREFVGGSSLKDFKLWEAKGQ